MIRINNEFIKGIIREESITAVWSEKEQASAIAAERGKWKVMLRSDRQDYLYCYCNSEYTACEMVDEIEKKINDKVIIDD